MSRELAKLVIARASLDEIRDCALSSGMTTMSSDARRKIIAGITTAEEAARVLGADPVSA